MKFVWKKDRSEKNTRLVFELNTNKNCNKINIYAVDSYQVWINGKFYCYGPERTAAGYSRKKTIHYENIKQVKIKVIAYNQDTYAVDRQLPFFCSEIYNDKNLQYDTCDFNCYEECNRIKNMPRFSFQRGYTEGYDYHRKGKEKIDCEYVPSPCILNGTGENCEYKEIRFIEQGNGKYTGFDEILVPWWDKKILISEKQSSYDINKELLSKTDNGYLYYDFCSEVEYTGFFKFKFEIEKDSEIFIVFDEILPDNKWIFRRADCNNFIYYSLPEGNFEIISAEPYGLKYLRIISNNEIKVKPYMILLQNDKLKDFYIEDEKLNKIFLAGKNTFMQNAVDIFMDCPLRERAGWLCDSYFMGKSEKFFTGENKIEKSFLENFIIGKVPEIPDGMIPMCFPSQHSIFIPNWAMWFVLEMEDYYNRTGDYKLLEKAKGKIFSLLEYFKKYENEYELLENLDGWIFLEWSICNNEEYIKGVNFPTNMLYAKTLSVVGHLYNQKDLVKKWERISQLINKISYNGKFYIENAVRENGMLKCCEKHISETCQYYALFSGMNTDKDFEERMANDFGPFRTNSYKEVGRSNIFIGNYLRFMWLMEKGEYERVLAEIRKYFLHMAEKTGTIWEHDSPKASCNHGFASYISVIIYDCLAKLTK